MPARQYVQRGDRPDVNFDALQGGERSGAGKVWQHEMAEGGGGGWFEADEAGKAAMPSEAAPEPAAPAAPSAGGGGGGIPGLALGGLRSASQPASPMGAMELPAPGAANPALGQRLYPMAMRQLAMLAPRIY